MEGWRDAEAVECGWRGDAERRREGVISSEPARRVVRTVLVN